MAQGVQHTHEFTVSGPNAAFDARRTFDDLAYDWLEPSIRAEAQLLISELVSAVVAQHATPRSLEIRVSPLARNGVRAEVGMLLGDGPQPVRAFRLIAGHRAQVLDGLADRWGLVHQVGAPYAWFELAGA